MSKRNPCGVELVEPRSVPVYRGRPVYHPVIKKSQYERDTEDWASRYRREQITWRVASLVVLAVFAFLVLD
jgi:hypothetical protein